MRLSLISLYYDEPCTTFFYDLQSEFIKKPGAALTTAVGGTNTGSTRCTFPGAVERLPLSALSREGFEDIESLFPI